LARRDYTEAKFDLVRAHELDPGNPDTFLLSAQLYTEVGRPSEAEAALRNAIAATPDPSRHPYEIARAHYQLGRLLLHSGDMDEGKKEMQKRSDLKPKLGRLSPAVMTILACMPPSERTMPSHPSISDAPQGGTRT